MAKAIAGRQSVGAAPFSVLCVGLGWPIDPTNDDDQRDRFHYAKHGARPGSDIGQAVVRSMEVPLLARGCRVAQAGLADRATGRCLRVTRAAAIVPASRRGHRKERGVPNLTLGNRGQVAARFRRSAVTFSNWNWQVDIRTYARSAGWACRLQHQSIFFEQATWEGAPMRSFIRPGRTYCPS